MEGIEVVSQTQEKDTIGENLHLIMAANVLSNNDLSLLNVLAASIQPSGFIILEETKDFSKSNFNANKDLLLICKQVADGKSYILLKKKQQLSRPNIIRMEPNNMSWLGKLKSTLKDSKKIGKPTVFVSQNDKFQGNFLQNTLSNENGSNAIFYDFYRDRRTNELFTKRTGLLKCSILFHPK